MAIRNSIYSCLRTLLLLILILLPMNSVSAKTTPILSPEELHHFADQFFTEAQMDKKFPGAALAIVKDGKIAFSRGYGYADLDNRTPVNADQTVFFVESVSKSFTATAIMQLAEKDLFDLHADVNEYLVSFQLEPAFPKPVTVADLLMHTGGFDDTDIGAYAKTEDEVIPLKDYVKNHLPLRVLPPGEVVSYSNHGYALAGLLVEEITLMKFADYMEEEILKPLDMNNSSFILSPEMENHLARPYLPQNDSYIPGIFLFHNYSPAGGLKATARDMANFIIAHLENGKHNGYQLLQENTIKEMHRRQFTHHDKLPGWVFGFYESYINGYHCLVHGGSNRLGHSSLLFMLPDENFGYFLSLNTFNLDLHDQFQAELMDKFYPEIAESRLPQVALDSDEQLNKYSGYYFSTRQARNSIEKIMLLLGQLQVRSEAGKLTVIYPQGEDAPGEWVKVGPLLFQNTGNGSLMAFRENGKGQVTHLFIDNQAYERLPWYTAASLQVAGLILSVIVFLSAATIWPFTCLRKSYLQDRLKAEKTGLYLAWALAAANLIFLVSLAVIFLNYQVELAFGMPGLLKLLLLVPYAIFILTATVLFYAAKILVEKRLTLFCRIHLTITALCSTGFIYFLYFWNLMGFYNGYR